MKQISIKQCRKDLLHWYQTSKREMPWRATRDPYHIWISEVMLQQTQVATVIDYFNRFIKRFPDIETLAAANLEDVLKRWEGLGYYSRARNLHKAVNQLVDMDIHQVPDTPETFMKLPGVGPYICAAVQSIAFGHPLAVVDGNVKRVLARLYTLDTPVNDACMHADFIEKAQALLEKDEPSSFNQAMMELGALICKPTAPNCPDCPISDFCKALKTGEIADYPKRNKKKPVPLRRRAAALILKGNRFLIIRRPISGFLGGLWELPDALVTPRTNTEKTFAAAIRKKTGLIIHGQIHLTTVKHAYTHFKLEQSLFVCQVEKKSKISLDGPSAYQWIELSQIDDFAFHKVMHKCFSAIKNHLADSK